MRLDYGKHAVVIGAAVAGVCDFIARAAQYELRQFDARVKRHGAGGAAPAAVGGPAPR